MNRKLWLSLITLTTLSLGGLSMVSADDSSLDLWLDSLVNDSSSTGNNNNQPTTNNTNNTNQQNTNNQQNNNINNQQNNNNQQPSSNTNKTLPQLEYSVWWNDSKRIEAKILDNDSNFIITFQPSDHTYIIDNVKLFNWLTWEDVSQSLKDVMKNISIVKVNTSSNDINKYYLSEINSNNWIVVNQGDNLYIIWELKQQDKWAIKQIIWDNKLAIEANLNTPDKFWKLINANSFEMQELYTYNKYENAISSFDNTKQTKKVKKQITWASDYIPFAVLFLILAIFWYYYNNKQRI